MINLSLYPETSSQILENYSKGAGFLVVSKISLFFRGSEKLGL